VLFSGITNEVKKQALKACFFDVKDFLNDTYQIIEFHQISPHLGKATIQGMTMRSIGHPGLAK